MSQKLMDGQTEKDRHHTEAGQSQRRDRERERETHTQRYTCRCL